jgi:hypothetical protein
VEEFIYLGTNLMNQILLRKETSADWSYRMPAIARAERFVFQFAIQEYKD